MRHMIVAVVVIAVGIVGSWLALVASWERTVHRTANPLHVHLE